MTTEKLWRMDEGFSLVEVLMTMALLVVLLGLAVPGVSTWRSRHELQSVAEDVWNSLMLARSQALVHQQRVVMCPAAPDNNCDAQGQWMLGWRVFVDNDHDGQRGARELVLQSRGVLPHAVRLQGNSTVSRGVRYGPDGLGDGLGGTFSLCSVATREGWKVIINAIGRPRMEKMEVPDCV
ncbi:MAG: GspH/FimT family pseudopilin [Limnohabitans sp.]